jgi:hypothetical protein
MTPEERARAIVFAVRDMTADNLGTRWEFVERQIREAIAAETERCARIAEQWGRVDEVLGPPSPGRAIASAIRSKAG